MQNLKKVKEYAKISDTPFDQRSLIHREAWFPGGPRIPKNPISLATEKIIQNAKTPGSVVSTMFCKAKSAKKNFFLRGNFRPLPNKNV